MELLEGEPLSTVLDRQRRLPVPTACEYTLQILAALEAAHALGVIHRDLKPENVFVTFAAGRPVLKLIDFGIAKARRTDPQQKNLTVAGVVMGTAEYMAPEQARSADKVDARADIYAVGVMLYEMLAGSRPVQGDDARVIALKVERGEVVPAGAGRARRAARAGGAGAPGDGRRGPSCASRRRPRCALALERHERRTSRHGGGARRAAAGGAAEVSATGPTGTLKNVSASGRAAGRRRGTSGRVSAPSRPPRRLPSAPSRPSPRCTPSARPPSRPRSRAPLPGRA